MDRDISSYRKSYKKNSLDKKNISISPLTLFDKWFNEINISNINSEINAMTLSTIDRHGFPKGRVVLLKYYSENGFTFFSNYDSEKSTAILNNNKVSISFFWEEFERQVIIKGFAKKTSKKISDDYFNSRPKGSKIGALVSSKQSSVISSKDILIKKFDELTTKFKDAIVKRPNNWGGFVISPIEYEFWQGGENRLHDRIRYRLTDKKWIIDRLSP